jgi:hypothetical protein
MSYHFGGFHAEIIPQSQGVEAQRACQGRYRGETSKKSTLSDA